MAETGITSKATARWCAANIGRALFAESGFDRVNKMLRQARREAQNRRES